MPHFLVRLPLTALISSLAMSATFAQASAAEPGPIAYVLEGLDGPEFAAAPGFPGTPGLVVARIEPVEGASIKSAAGVSALALITSAGPVFGGSLFALPVLAHPIPMDAAAIAEAVAAHPAQLVASALPLLSMQTAAATALPQGPMPDGTSLAALVAATSPVLEAAGRQAADGPSRLAVPIAPPTQEFSDAANSAVDANGELLPIDPAQRPVLAVAMVSAPDAPFPRIKPAVRSILDGPGPLPEQRPVSSMVTSSMAGPAEPAAPASASAEAAAGGGDPPLDDPDPAAATSAADTDPDAASADKPVPASPGETEPLRDAIIASLKGNPEIQIALAQQDDAKYGVTEARAGYLPKVDVTAAWGREFVRTVPQAPTQRYRTEATVSLNQNLWDFGVTINDIKRARAVYRSAQWGTREKIEAISYDITNAYLGVLLQQKLVELAEGEIASIKKILRIVTVQKDLGLTTPADVERAQTRLENVRSQLLDRSSALEQARNAYKRLTNRFPLRAADVPASGQALPESADVAVDMIDTRSPRLAQAVEDRRSLDKQYDSQADTTLPRFGLTIASDYRRDVMGATGRAFDARAMVTMSYQLYNGGATTAVKRRIGARLRQADYELDRRRREVEQDIRIDYAALGAANEKIATIEDEITSAQRVADLYKQQFRGGRRTVFDLLDSEQLLFGARAKQTTNQIALRAAEYRVLQKLGGLFDLVSGGQALPALVVPAPGSDE